MIRYPLIVLMLAGCWNKPVHVDVRNGKVCVHKVTVEGNEFYWHTDVRDRSERFNLALLGYDLLEGLRETESTSNLKEFRSFHRIGHICIRTIARAYSGREFADFWVFVTYGHTGDARPIYSRQPLSISVTGGDVIKLDDPPASGLPIAHGQGLPIAHFRYNCTTGKQVATAIYQDLMDAATVDVPPFGLIPRPPWWVNDPDVACADVALSDTRHYKPFEQTKYTPTFPGMTGGQQQFGTFQVTPELNSNGYRLGSWRLQLYQEGCRPAHFLHPDGSRVTEDDYPLTVLTSSGWIHERSDGKYWIQHTYPSSPWRDKGARDPSGRAWTYWDAQHWSLNALCQVFHVYGDPGLGLLIGDLAEGWLWSNPVVDKGTTHHHVASSARARGRVLEAGCSLAQVLKGDIRDRLVSRVDQLVSIQVAEFQRCLASNETPIVYRRDGASVWEHALWVKGLFAAISLLPSRSVEIHAMASHIGRWVLGGFKDYGRWYVPYVIRRDNTYSSKPSKQLSLWCLPVVELLDIFERSNLSTAEGKKITEILDEFRTDPPLNGGYGDQTKWRLMR